MTEDTCGDEIQNVPRKWLKHQPLLPDLHYVTYYVTMNPVLKTKWHRHYREEEKNSEGFPWHRETLGFSTLLTLCDLPIVVTLEFWQLAEVCPAHILNILPGWIWTSLCFWLRVKVMLKMQHFYSLFYFLLKT